MYYPQMQTQACPFCLQARMLPAFDYMMRDQGVGVVQMGEDKSNLNFQHYVGPGTAILVPAGTWHNLINTGSTPMKLYTIYGPPNHPHGTVHQTKADAEKEHN